MSQINEYEVERRGEGPSVLVSIVKGGTARSAGRLGGSPCFKELHGRSEPCPGCPVERSMVTGRAARSVIRRGGGTTRFDVVSARLVAPHRHRVSVWPIDDALLSQLVVARVDALCERAGLSARERAALDLLMLGSSQEDIARELRISVRTVKYHQGNVHRKLGAESRLDLMRLFL